LGGGWLGRRRRRGRRRGEVEADVVEGKDDPGLRRMG
jgi:hypothetical protein